MYRWGFDMVNVNSVEALSWHLPGPDFAILREEEDAMPAQLFFSSRHLNELEDEREVQARGEALKTLVDGALHLEHGLRHRRERICELWDLRRERRVGCPVPASGVQPFSIAVCSAPLTEGEQAVVSTNLLEGSVYTARTEAVVFGMLKRLGFDGITWQSLYALTDTMKTHGFGEEEQWQAAGASRSAYRSFKHTANSFQALGPLARHGETKDAPPQRPMDIDAAADLVMAAARRFVARRVQRATATFGVSPRRAVAVSGGDLTMCPERSTGTAGEAGGARAAEPVPTAVHIETERSAPTGLAGMAAVALAIASLAAGVAAWSLARRQARGRSRD